jgi:phage/plasmid-like protein (TIGR03299 family)
MKALVRETDNRVLTQVGENWHPVQNEEAFDFFKEFVETGDMSMSTAGALKDGRIVWALAKTKDDFELFGGDKVESYLLFTNPHMYGKSLEIRWTSTRVVCNNTLQLALQGNKSGVTLNHRQAFDPDYVKQIMGLSSNKMHEFKEAAEFLGSKRTTDATVKEYFGHLLGYSNKKPDELSRTARKVMELIPEQPGAEFAEGTWWQPLNAITYATDHILGRNNDTRLQSAWYGINRDLKVKALNKALEMAKVA